MWHVQPLSDFDRGERLAVLCGRRRALERELTLLVSGYLTKPWDLYTEPPEGSLHSEQLEQIRSSLCYTYGEIAFFLRQQEHPRGPVRPMPRSDSSLPQPVSTPDVTPGHDGARRPHVDFLWPPAAVTAVTEAAGLQDLARRFEALASDSASASASTATTASTALPQPVPAIAPSSPDLSRSAPSDFTASLRHLRSRRSEIWRRLRSLEPMTDSSGDEGHGPEEAGPRARVSVKPKMEQLRRRLVQIEAEVSALKAAHSRQRQPLGTD
jgi:hypothetical protein